MKLSTNYNQNKLKGVTCSYAPSDWGCLLGMIVAGSSQLLMLTSSVVTIS
jgi:hypothetical protein